jgi:hypothetical protein
VSVLDEYRNNATRFSFPFINTEHEYRDITVELRGRPGSDSWAICDGFGKCYQPRGRRWSYERRPSSRTDKYIKASRMSLEEALPIAERLAETEAKRWEKRLARMIARREAAEAAKKAQEGS